MVYGTNYCIRLSSSPSTISDELDDNELDDSLSLVASDAEELSGSVTDPALLTLSASRNARLRADEELIRVMTKAVNKIGLEWSPPEEPSRSRLDEWFLPGRHQVLCQCLSPFFPEVHDELTKSWCAPYSSEPQSHITDAGCAYLVAGQAASALHSMAVLQVFQAKMLSYEEAGLDSASLRDLRSATDLALRATKAGIRYPV